MAKNKIEQDDFIMDSELADGDLSDAQAAIAASNESAQRLMQASRELESLVQNVVSDEVNSLATTELDLLQAKTFLETHRLRRARKSVRRAEKALNLLEEDVLYLRRSIAMLHRLLREKALAEEEVENVLRRLRNATGAAEIGDVGYAATEVEYLVDDLIGGNSSTLNPFLFRHFWLSVDTRWPAGGETGILLVRIINDGDIPLPMMRLAPPVPDGWVAKPSFIDVPVIGPGGNLPVRFEIQADRRHGADEVPLSRKLSIATGYEMRNGNVTVTIRAQNRSMEPLVDVLIDLGCHQALRPTRCHSSAGLRPMRWLLCAFLFESTWVMEVLPDPYPIPPSIEGGRVKKGEKNENRKRNEARRTCCDWYWCNDCIHCIDSGCGSGSCGHYSDR